MNDVVVWRYIAAVCVLTYVLRTFPFLIVRWWSPKLPPTFMKFLDASSYSMLGSIIADAVLQPMLTSHSMLAIQATEVTAKLCLIGLTVVMVIRFKRLDLPLALAFSLLAMLVYIFPA